MDVRTVAHDAPERRDVEVDVIALERYLAPVNAQPRTAETGPQDAEGPAQRAASVLRVRLRPQQLRQRFPGDGPTDDGHVGEQGDRLARVNLDRPAIRVNLRGTEQGDPQRQDGPPPLVGSAHDWAGCDNRPVTIPEWSMPRMVP